jgi:hypothetical protein
VDERGPSEWLGTRAGDSELGGLLLDQHQLLAYTLLIYQEPIDQGGRLYEEVTR